MRELLRDVRHSLTLIRLHPGHAAAVLLTLAVAIGVGTVVIALVDGIVLRPLPFDGSERVVHIWETHESFEHKVASYPDLRDWSASAHSFDGVAIARSWPYKMSTPSGQTGLDAAVATPQWLPIHSLRPRLGRFFGEEEMRNGSNHVAVLSHRLWRERFGGDPAVLHRQIQLDGEPFQIIGVLPEHAWIYELDDADVWLPLTAIHDEVEKRSWRGFSAIGRLRPGTSPNTAKQELQAIQQRLAKTYPESNRGWSVDLEPLRNSIAGPVRRLLFIFLASIGVVLLIACANIANLALAFNSWRTREFSIRYALGARTSHIARQILIESVVLALFGGAAGLAVGQAGLKLFRAVAPSGIPRLDEVAIDPRTAAIVVGLSVLSAFLFGLLPARAAARAGTMSGVRTTGPGTDLRRVLVVTELALAFVLVIATGLMTRAFSRLLDWTPGFRPDGVAVMWTFTGGQEKDAVEMFDRAAHVIAAIPGVTAVGQTSAGPLFGGVEDSEVRVIGRPALTGSKATARYYDVSPDYFRTLGIPLLRGRELSDTDRRGTEPVAVINEAMARRFWGDADPIGARVELDKQPWQIVGVVGNVHPFRPDEPPQPEIFWPKRQSPRLATYFVVRSSLPVAALQQQAGDALKKQEPALDIGTFDTLPDLATHQRVRPRFNVVVVSILSALAFVLAAIGIYGVVSFSVVSRAREIAIRLAVGANPKRVVWEVVRDGGKMIAGGLLVGVFAALAVTRWLASFLFGLSPLDPLTWTGVSIAFAAIVLVACWVPARRAAAIDPATSLRVE